MSKNLPRAHRWAKHAAFEGHAVTIPFLLGLQAAQVITESNERTPDAPYSGFPQEHQAFVQGLSYGIRCHARESTLLAQLVVANASAEH